MDGLGKEVNELPCTVLQSSPAAFDLPLFGRIVRRLATRSVPALDAGAWMIRAQGAAGLPGKMSRVSGASG